MNGYAHTFLIGTHRGLHWKARFCKSVCVVMMMVIVMMMSLSKKRKTASERGREREAS